LPLTAATIRNLQPKAQSYKQHDGRRLFVLVKPNGSKLWRFKYKLAR
jgi:hypothetical protein